MFEPASSTNGPSTELEKQGINCVPIIRSKLIEKQARDPEIKPLFDQAIDLVSVETISCRYYLQSSVLMIKSHPLDILADHELSVNHQVVVTVFKAI